MGRNLPAENNAALIWLEAHIDQWQADPISVGLTQVEADELAAEIVATRAERTAAQTTRQTAITTTRSYNDRADGLRAIASPLIAAIKHYGDIASDPSVVYTAAGLLRPAPRSPVALPSRPVITGTVLNPKGFAVIKWQATGPTGTVYNVMRKLPGEMGFTLIGQGGGRVKEFADETVPLGTHSAAYLVQGVRGQTKGPVSGAISVYFGAKTTSTSHSTAA